MDKFNDLFSKNNERNDKPKRNNNVASDTRIHPKETLKKNSDGYGAEHIEVLEGLEPVRRRPGMYIGGTDSKAMHHLFAEVIDNSMDEAVAGHANWIDVELDEEGYLCVSDNGRGIPVEPHPKFKNKSTVEVVMTMLHAGGKFDSGAYETSGGLHGVGVSVVNALSEHVEVEVASNRRLYKQEFKRGAPLYKLRNIGDVHNRRGTRIRFKPDPEIFGETCRFIPSLLMKMARSKAYLFGGVKIRWSCASCLISQKEEIPTKAEFYFPDGLKGYLMEVVDTRYQVTPEPFSGQSGKSGTHGFLEWAVIWHGNDGFVNSYCNTIPTGDGGAHEAGLRVALARGLKTYGEITGNKKASTITTDDVMISAVAMLSVFMREPEFVGQTKDKLATVEAQRIVENAIRDPFDHWLAASPQQSNRLLEWVLERTDERLKRRKEKEISRKSAVRKLRLPGKLADCSRGLREGAELFIVEGDSAGGSAKQARNRKTQAVLPLRGKILNVASSSREKIIANQQINDIALALGTGVRSGYRDQDLRYERIIIMTDADVDGAHIASLLIAFFFQEMPELISSGHLYLAVPPLYRITQGAKTLYARDENHRAELLKTEFNHGKKIDTGRFKGLGEMMPAQLKETTMDPAKRILLQIEIPSGIEEETRFCVDQLMGTRPEARFAFIQENALFVETMDV